MATSRYTNVMRFFIFEIPFNSVSFLGRLLLDLDAYGGAGPDGIFPLFFLLKLLSTWPLKFQFFSVKS